ncbi:MAG TPA: glycoside hydrolase family 25 protein [Flavisolibacter sp.]|nr:glycoside hydrolase family 25 protein [Flavisolibacter sp.]
MAKRKSNSSLRPFLLLTLISAGCFFAYLFYLWAVTPGPASVRYDEFGISIPARYEIHGIDVSRYQHAVSWKMVKDMKVRNVRIGFAFIKATEGTNLVDPFFKRNWKRAKEAGMTRGAYHFFNPRKDGKSQAKQFLNTVKLESGDLPPVLDIEKGWNIPKAKIQQEVKVWLDAVEAAYGVKPIIYTYVTFYEKYLKGAFDDYPLWIAHYYQPNSPRIKRPWQFWQHSEEGRVNGIRSKVDFNVFNGDSTDFRALLVP